MTAEAVVGAPNDDALGWLWQLAEAVDSDRLPVGVGRGNGTPLWSDVVPDPPGPEPDPPAPRIQELMDAGVPRPVAEAVATCERRSSLPASPPMGWRLSRPMPRWCWFIQRWWTRFGAIPAVPRPPTAGGPLPPACPSRSARRVVSSRTSPATVNGAYTHEMSKRLQVILTESEFQDLRSLAENEGLTISEWVRQTVRRARRQRSAGDVEQRLTAIRTAARHSFPTADVDQMLREIERGYHPS